MHEYLRRSDSIWHTNENEKDRLTGYMPSSKEKQDGEQPHQKMQMENSYGQMSLGISKNGDMTFVVSGKKEIDETPVTSAQKQLDGDQMTRENRKVYSGNRPDAESAVVYKGSIRKHRERVLMLYKKS